MNRPDRTTLIAFTFLVLIGGSNAVAVRFSNQELPPFWGAAIRFAAAALILWIIVAVRRIEIPRGRALTGVLIFVVMAAWLLGEAVTLSFLIGGAIVLLGVWVGAFGGPAAKAKVADLPEPEEAGI